MDGWVNDIRLRRCGIQTFSFDPPHQDLHPPSELCRSPFAPLPCPSHRSPRPVSLYRPLLVDQEAPASKRARHSAGASSSSSQNPGSNQLPQLGPSTTTAHITTQAIKGLEAVEKRKLEVAKTALTKAQTTGGSRKTAEPGRTRASGRGKVL